MSVNRQQFAQAVLQAGGWPETQSNINFLVAWMHREGGTAANNPINTTHDAPGATAYNGVGVKNYPTMQAGVSAIVDTLQGGFYGNIRNALASGDATTWDKEGKLAPDLHAWSAGPNAPASQGYTSVTGDGILGNIADLAKNFVSTVGSTVGGAASDAQQAAQNTQLATGDIDGFLKSQAPELAKALDDPEVQQLLAKWGAPNGLSDQEFQNQLEATSWWKNTPYSQRQMLIEKATDPATAAQNITQAAHTLDTLAKQMGVGLPGGSEYQLVMDGMRNGWILSDGSIKDSSLAQQKLATYYKQNSAQANTGAAATDADQLRQLYAEYALPVSPQKLSTQIQTVLSGTQSLNDVQAQIAQQAKTLYATNPQLVQAIEGGQTVKQWADPYLQHAANTLGLNPNSINLSAPMWQRVLNPYTDPKTGASTGQAMSLDQWDQVLRTSPEYGFDHSQNAINTASSFATQLVSKLTGAGV